MTKIKTCKFLDAKQQGAVILIGDASKICYDRGIKITDIKDYGNIDIDKIIEGRRAFINDLNSGKTDKCDGCECLQIREENEVDQEKISWLNIASFTTCTLRCKYCYFNNNELGAKLADENRLLMPIVMQLHNKKILTDNVCLAIAGGEPLLFKDIPETLLFLKKNYNNPRFNFQSNCTITPKVKELANVLKNTEMSWKNLYTSLDSGTRETFKKIRGRDLYNVVKENILTFARSNCFTDIQLKYILLDGKDGNYNLSKKDIIGFCNFVKQVKENTLSHVSIAIDRDLKYGNQPLSKALLDSAIKVAKFAHQNNIPYYLSNCGFISEEDRQKINKEVLEAKKLPLIQQIFSVKNENCHKVFRIMGIKIKLKKKSAI